MTTIPRITHPLGKAWDQPHHSSFLVDDHHAVMSEKTMLRFKDYSCSFPSGVYEGKIWRATVTDRSNGRKVNLLRWYGPSENPDKCTINEREILLID